MPTGGAITRLAQTHEPLQSQGQAVHRQRSMCLIHSWLTLESGPHKQIGTTECVAILGVALVEDRRVLGVVGGEDGWGGLAAVAGGVRVRTARIGSG